MMQLTAISLVAIWLVFIITAAAAALQGLSFKEAWLSLPGHLAVPSLMITASLIYILLPDHKDTGKKPSTLRVKKDGSLDHIEETTYHD